MGKIGRSWELVKQSFAILRSNKELMLLPIVSAASCLLLSGMIIGGGGWAAYSQAASAPGVHGRAELSPPLLLGGLFVLYVANYFVIVFFNLALVAVAFNRLEGGAWTIREGLSLAWKRRGKVLQWALLAATVGLILRMVEERMGWLGQIVTRLIGLAWALACSFVVPVLAFEDLGPVDALKRSARLFRDNWGEHVAGSFSFGLIIFLLALPCIGLCLAGMILAGVPPAIAGAVVLLLALLVSVVVGSATQGIFTAALYRYATTRQVSGGFRLENFSMAWQKK